MFALHEIFPKGDGAFLAMVVLALVVGLLTIVVKLLLALGAVATVARGRARLGPLDLRGVKPASIGTWLIALVLCALSATFYLSDSLMVVPTLVLGPGSNIAGSFTGELLPMAVIGSVLASVYWTLVLTGARAAWSMFRRPRPAPVTPAT